MSHVLSRSSSSECSTPKRVQNVAGGSGPQPRGAEGDTLRIINSAPTTVHDGGPTTADIFSSRDSQFFK